MYCKCDPRDGTHMPLLTRAKRVLCAPLPPSDRRSRVGVACDATDGAPLISATGRREVDNTARKQLMLCVFVCIACSTFARCTGLLLLCAPVWEKQQNTSGCIWQRQPAPVLVDTRNCRFCGMMFQSVCTYDDIAMLLFHATVECVVDVVWSMVTFS